MMFALLTGAALLSSSPWVWFGLAVALAVVVYGWSLWKILTKRLLAKSVTVPAWASKVVVSGLVVTGLLLLAITVRQVTQESASGAKPDDQTFAEPQPPPSAQTSVQPTPDVKAMTPEPEPPQPKTPTTLKPSQGHTSPVLNLQVDVDGLPFLMRTNHDKAVQLIPIRSKDEGVEVIFEVKLDAPDSRNIPHNLWMIVLSNVTIWNKSQRRVSLQFELKTTVKGPVRLSELSMNMSGRASEFQKLAALDRIPITLQEHGPGRAASRLPDVLTGGQEKYPYLHGPLDIDPLSHAQGVLAFFYQQLDSQDPRIDFFNASLVIHDRLSGVSKTFEPAELR